MAYNPNKGWTPQRSQRAQQLSKYYEPRVQEGSQRTNLDRFFDVLSIGTYASAGAARGFASGMGIEGALEGFAEGIRAGNPLGEGFEAGEHTYSKVLDDMGWQPTSTAGKFARGAVGFAGDVLLDPLTYVTLGTGALAKGTGKAGKLGAKAFTHEMAEQALKRTGREVTEEATVDLMTRVNKLKGIKSGGAGISAFGKEFVSADTIRAVGDKTIAPYVNDFTRSMKTSKLGEKLSTKHNLWKASILENNDVVADFAMYMDDLDKLRVDKATKKEMARRISKGLGELSDVQQRTITDLLENEEFWKPARGKFSDSDLAEQVRNDLKKYVKRYEDKFLNPAKQNPLQLPEPGRVIHLPGRTEPIRLGGRTVNEIEHGVIELDGPVAKMFKDGSTNKFDIRNDAYNLLKYNDIYEQVGTDVIEKSTGEKVSSLVDNMYGITRQARMTDWKGLSNADKIDELNEIVYGGSKIIPYHMSKGSVDSAVRALRSGKKGSFDKWLNMNKLNFDEFGATAYQKIAKELGYGGQEYYSRVTGKIHTDFDALKRRRIDLFESKGSAQEIAKIDEIIEKRKALIDKFDTLDREGKRAFLHKLDLKQSFNDLTSDAFTEATGRGGARAIDPELARIKKMTSETASELTERENQRISKYVEGRIKTFDAEAKDKLAKFRSDWIKKNGNDEGKAFEVARATFRRDLIKERRRLENLEDFLKYRSNSTAKNTKSFDELLDEEIANSYRRTQSANQINKNLEGNEFGVKHAKQGRKVLETRTPDPVKVADKAEDAVPWDELANETLTDKIAREAEFTPEQMYNYTKRYEKYKKALENDDLLETIALQKHGKDKVDEAIGVIEGKMNIDFADYDELVIDTAKYMRETFKGVGLEEVKAGALDAGQLKANLNSYVAHVITPEADKKIKEYYDMLQAGKALPDEIDEFMRHFLDDGDTLNTFGISRKLKAGTTIGKTTLKDGSVKEINEVFLDILEGDKLFQDKISDIYLARMGKHYDVVYDKNVTNQALESFGRHIDLDGTIPAQQRAVLDIDKIKGNEEMIKRLNEMGYGDQATNQIGARLVRLTEQDAKRLAREFGDDGIRTMPDLIVDKMNNVANTQAGKDTHQLLRAYDRFLNLFRINMTTTPAFHTQNIIGNQFQNYLAIGDRVLDPKLQSDAMSFVLEPETFAKLKKKLGKEGVLSEDTMKVYNSDFANVNAKRLTRGDKLEDYIGGVADEFDAEFILNGQPYSREMLEDLMHDYGVLDKGMFAADLDTEAQGLLFKDKITPSLNPTDAKNFAPYKASKYIGNRIENQARVANFLGGLDSGLSPSEAAEQVNKFLFDYTDLTDFEKSHMRRIFPFYTWMRKNAPLQIEQMISQPNKYRAVSKAFKEIEDMNDEKIAEKDRPKYARDWVQLPYTHISADGSEQVMFWNPNLPFIDANLIPNPFNPEDSVRSLFGRLSPAINKPIELGVGKNIYFDAKLSDMYRGSMSPELEYLLDNIPQLKMAKDVREKEGLAKGMSAANAVTGVKVSVQTKNERKEEILANRIDMLGVR